MMRILAGSLGGLTLFAMAFFAAPGAFAQTQPPSPAEIQNQHNQAVQDQTFTTQQRSQQLQMQLEQNRARQQQLFNAAPSPFTRSDPFHPLHPAPRPVH